VGFVTELGRPVPMDGPMFLFIRTESKPSKGDINLFLSSILLDIVVNN
jgi:hypothetical protein